MNSPHSRRRARLPAALSLILSLTVLPLALSGCGNKGPLVLPEDAEPAQAVATPAAAASEPAPDAALDAASGKAPAADAPPADAPADPPPAHD